MIKFQERSSRNHVKGMIVVLARFIDASRYLSRDSYRDTVCKFFFFCSLDTIIL